MNNSRCVGNSSSSAPWRLQLLVAAAIVTVGGSLPVQVWRFDFFCLGRPAACAGCKTLGHHVFKNAEVSASRCARVQDIARPASLLEPGSVVEPGVFDCPACDQRGNDLRRNRHSRSVRFDPDGGLDESTECRHLGVVERAQGAGRISGQRFERWDADGLVNTSEPTDVDGSSLSWITCSMSSRSMMRCFHRNRGRPALVCQPRRVTGGRHGESCRVCPVSDSVELAPRTHRSVSWSRHSFCDRSLLL